jgi:molybdenum cofactor cytidylyltransferase
MQDQSIAIFILAAGSSSRMGSPKQLAKINGKTLLELTIEASIGSLANKIYVILGFQAHKIQKTIDKTEIQVLYNPDWQLGIGTSVKLAAKKLLVESQDIDAAIFTVCDMPYLSAEHINNLINAYSLSNKSIVASSYNSISGVPALFDRSQFPKLMVIPDQTGAQPIINYAQPEDIITIPFEEGRLDIDYLSDLDKF